MATKKQTSQKLTDFDKVLAALSYVWVLVFIPYVLGHSNPFVYRHAKLGLVLFIFEVFLMLVGWIPILGWLIGLAGWIIVCLISVVGIAHALSGKDYTVPFFSEYANKKRK